MFLLQTQLCIPITGQFLSVPLATGKMLDGVYSETAAQKLRGHVGTIVTVKVHDASLLFCYINEPCKCDAIQTLGSLQFSHSGVVVPQSDVPDDKICNLQV